MHQIGMGDSWSFSSEGLTGEVTAPGHSGLFFLLLRCGCTGALNVKATHCPCASVGGNKGIHSHQPRGAAGI